MKIARDGFREIGIALVTLGPLTAAGVWAALNYSPWFWAAAVVPFVFLVFTFAFFRDPHRNVPQSLGLMVSPADGKVTDVVEVREVPGIVGPALRISIFLSVFDVHINRMPCDATIDKLEYKPGKFLDARDPDCAVLNEKLTLFMTTSDENAGILVRQIAGKIARRIICHPKEGATLNRGERFGMIKFGSRTDLVVPVSLGYKPVVKVGDRVSGGDTVLLRKEA